MLPTHEPLLPQQIIFISPVFHPKFRLDLVPRLAWVACFRSASELFWRDLPEVDD